VVASSLESEDSNQKMVPMIGRYICSKLETVLSKFDEHLITTRLLLISEQEPQASLAIPIYYELHDMLEDAVSEEDEFSALVRTCFLPFPLVQKSIRNIMSWWIGRIALILDPRFKTLLLENEPGDDAAPIAISMISWRILNP
jgi:hypothetical protein